MTHIHADNIVVDFPIYGVQSRSFKKNLVRAATGGRVAHDANDRIVVRAVDHVSIAVEKGDRIGLMGHNGAGKSTLLRTIAGIYEPTSGTVSVRGRVASLLSVTVGMEQESTGYENIQLQGIMFGLTRKEIDAKTAQIAEFTELGDYLDMPLRTYSSGMAMRIAFGVVTSIEPDIILMDEWISVGDANFIDKADARLDEFVRRAGILVLASHSPELLRRNCNKGIVLQHGKAVFIGGIEEALRMYSQGD
jgi:homopolymeric O-antigen transport system ATP-binding protein